MENKINYIKKELEKLVEEQREQFQSEIDLNPEAKSMRLIRGEEHNYFVQGIDNAYQLMCKVFNVRYEPIHSELKI